jgi:hypothetical protein
MCGLQGCLARNLKEIRNKIVREEWRGIPSLYIVSVDWLAGQLQARAPAHRMWPGGALFRVRNSSHASALWRLSRGRGGKAKAPGNKQLQDCSAFRLLPGYLWGCQLGLWPCPHEWGRPQGTGPGIQHGVQVGKAAGWCLLGIRQLLPSVTQVHRHKPCCQLTSPRVQASESLPDSETGDLESSWWTGENWVIIPALTVSPACHQLHLLRVNHSRGSGFHGITGTQGGKKKDWKKKKTPRKLKQECLQLKPSPLSFLPCLATCANTVQLFILLSYTALNLCYLGLCLCAIDKNPHLPLEVR